MARFDSGVRFDSGARFDEPDEDDPLPNPNQQPKNQKMKRQDYFPVRIGDQVIWLRNLRHKLLGAPAAGPQPAIVGHVVTLSLDATKAAAIGLDIDNAVYALETYRGAFQTATDAISQRIDHALYSEGLSGSISWLGFTPPAAPAAVPYGVMRRIFAYISDVVKKAPGYESSIGADLGIEGSIKPEPVEAETEPEFSLRLTTAHKVEVVWTKGIFDGVKLEFDLGPGGTKADVDLRPNYTLNWLPPAGTAVAVKVRLRYIYKGEDFGNWSAWQTIMLAAV